MHRRRLLEILDLYGAAHPGERDVADRVRAFVATHADCFERSCAPGHVTGSAWVLSADHRYVLLTHHRKLGRWLQLGGHCDGDPDPLRVAMREASEESGLADLRLLLPAGARVPPVPFDLDIHEIPARPGEPRHLHHDVRYLLVAAPGQRLAISEESNDLRWVARERLRTYTSEPSQLRMEEKTRHVLGSRPTLFP